MKRELEKFSTSELMAELRARSREKLRIQEEFGLTALLKVFAQNPTPENKAALEAAYRRFTQQEETE